MIFDGTSINPHDTSYFHDVVDGDTIYFREEQTEC